MSSEGFMKPIISGTNHWYKVGMQQFAWAKKLQGTKCIVTRLGEESKYTSVFGSLVTSTLKDDNEKMEFPYVVIINLEDMLKLFQKSINTLDFYDNEDKLKLGDVLRFDSNGQEFKFQVIDIQTFSHAGAVLNRITIQGLVEVNSTKPLE